MYLFRSAKQAPCPTGRRPARTSRPSCSRSGCRSRTRSRRRACPSGSTSRCRRNPRRSRCAYSRAPSAGHSTCSPSRSTSCRTAADRGCTGRTGYDSGSTHFQPFLEQQLSPQRVLPAGHFGVHDSAGAAAAGQRQRRALGSLGTAVALTQLLTGRAGRKADRALEARTRSARSSFPDRPQNGRASGGHANGLSQRPLPVVAAAVVARAARTSAALRRTALHAVGGRVADDVSALDRRAERPLRRLNGVGAGSCRATPTRRPPAPVKGATTALQRAREPTRAGAGHGDAASASPGYARESPSTTSGRSSGAAAPACGRDHPPSAVVHCARELRHLKRALGRPCGFGLRLHRERPALTRSVGRRARGAV